MRGNHVIWGRQDYVEPPPLPSESLRRISDCHVRLKEGTKTWHEVWIGGKLIGYVTSRLAGQSFRTLEMDSWMPVVSTSNRQDPKHAQAILGLLDAVNYHTTLPNDSGAH